MWDTANQLFGICGLVATVVELIYIIINRESFNNFELFFFGTTSACEVLSEVYLLSVGLVVLRDYGFSWNIIRLLVKDPVHILAGIRIITWNSKAALVAIVRSASPVGIWVAFLPKLALGFREYTGDEGLQWALSLCSAALCLAHVILLWYFNRSDKKVKVHYSFVSLTYIMLKVFELCCLIKKGF